MNHLTLPIIVLILGCVVAEGITQLCFKQGANHSTLMQSLVKPIVWLGLALWGAEVIAWIYVLERVPLTIAFPLMSLTYITTLLAAKLMFHEHVNRRHTLGAILITAGVACVGATGL